MIASAATPLLEVRGVTRRFQGLVSVDNVSFALAQREILGLVGPNGAGKTTLINLISGSLLLTVARSGSRACASMGCHPIAGRVLESPVPFKL